MTFEERIDRLTERHEALAQTVELNSHQIAEMRVLIDRNNKTAELCLEGILELGRIVRIHEARLVRLEGQ